MLPALVESAIVTTILGMAAFDRWSERHPQRCPTAVGMSLVLACSRIHGRGRAGALSDLGLDSENKWLTLAGFNLGIELGQIAVALVAAANGTIRSLRGLSAAHMMTRTA